MWSIAFEACRKESLKVVRWFNGPQRIFHSQTGTRFAHKSIRLNPVVFTQQGTTLQSFMISTTLNPPHRIRNSLILFLQTIRIFFLLLCVWKVVYTVRIQCRERQMLIRNLKRPLCFLVEAIPPCIYIKLYHRANIRGKYADGLYHSMVNDNDGHIPSPLIMFTCTALIVLATVRGYPALVWVWNGTETPVRVRNRQGSEPDNEHCVITRTEPKCWGFWAGRYRTVGPFSGSFIVGNN